MEDKKSNRGGSRPGAGRPKDSNAKSPGERGRRSKFKPEYVEQAEKLCKLGATDAEIADFFGVAESTLNLWKKRHPEFSKSLKKGKLEADATVADRLFKRATGYSHQAEKIFNNDGEIVRAEYIKHYPPDTTACIFWLKNRQPDKWRDKVEHEAQMDIRAIPFDELEKISQKAHEEAERKHREIVEGRAERLGIDLNYTSEDSND
jgi:hypothetical protein